MNRQPYQTPPRWWSPRLSSRWMRFWRPLRRRRSVLHHGLENVEIRGQENLLAVIGAGHGVLITPNHPTHADPFALLTAADELEIPLYFMTAWQVFAKTHWLGRQVLRQHGAFSINREGHDLRAIRQAIHVLHEGKNPLVIFPEGEVFHLNDRVTPFRRGAATIALLAARRRGRPVACVPCGMKFQYVDNPLPRLMEVVDRLEARFDWHPNTEMPLAKRIQRVIECLLATKEVEYFGRIGTRSLSERVTQLMLTLLGRLEDRYGIKSAKANTPERVKELRLRVIGRLEAIPDVAQQRQASRDLDDLFLVNQLFSYPEEYLLEEPTIERMAETLDKLEEDVLNVSTANLRGLRRAVISFGEPVLVQPRRVVQSDVAWITSALQARVQGLLDEVNGKRARSFPEAPVAGDWPINSGPMPALQFA